MNEKNLEWLWHFIRARELIRMKRAAGEPYPWTDDPILRTYHFCNVRQGQDRTSEGLRAVVRAREDIYASDLPWIYTLGRMFNNPAALRVALAANGDGIDWEWALREWEAADNRLSASRRYKQDLRHVAKVVGAVRSKLISTGSCYRVFGILQDVPGIGHFLSNQVVSDLKNDRFLAAAIDKHRFVVPAPREVAGAQWLSPVPFPKLLVELSGMLPPDVANMRLTFQDLAHTLGEFNNYMKALNGATNLRNYRGAE